MEGGGGGRVEGLWLCGLWDPAERPDVRGGISGAFVGRLAATMGGLGFPFLYLCDLHFTLGFGYLAFCYPY